MTERIVELKAALKTTTEEADRILGTIVDETGDGKFVLSTEKKAEIDRLNGTVNEIKGLISLQEVIDGVAAGDAAGLEGKDYGFGPMDSAALRQAIEQAREEGREASMEAKSLGEAFVDSQEFKDFVADGGRGTGAGFEMKDVHTASVAATTNRGFGKTQKDPMVLRQHRMHRVRDLFPSQGTTANLIEFIRVTGLTNNAAPVAERIAGPAFGLKPQSTLTFAPAQAPVRTIAHWEAAHRNVLEDEPQLRGIIENELDYGLRLTEDAQLLSGDGTGENILGLLNHPGVQTYDWSDGPTDVTAAQVDHKGDAVRRSITKVLLAYYEATGVVVNPLDWEDIELSKDAEGRYIATVGIAIGAEQRLWRLPVVDTPAMPEGTWVTGAFGLGASIYDRSGTTIRMAEQHADFFLRNAVVVLAEQRLAFAVKRPEAFVVGSFDAAPTPA